MFCIECYWPMFLLRSVLKSYQYNLWRYKTLENRLFYRHFQKHYLDKKNRTMIPIPLMVVPGILMSNGLSTSLGNGLTPYRWHAITWRVMTQSTWRHLASPGTTELDQLTLDSFNQWYDLIYKWNPSFLQPSIVSRTDAVLLQKSILFYYVYFSIFISISFAFSSHNVTFSMVSFLLNSLRLSDAQMRRLTNEHWSAPSHYLHQLWVIRNKFEWNFNQNT